MLFDWDDNKNQQNIRRIISARKATRQERKRYEKALYTSFER